MVVAVGFIFKLAIGLELLLHFLRYTDGVHHQFEILEDFRLVSGDVAFNGIVAKQLGQVALRHHQIEQVGAIVFFGVLVLGLDLTHLLFQYDDLLDGGQLLVTLRGFEVCALLWGRGLM